MTILLFLFRLFLSRFFRFYFYELPYEMVKSNNQNMHFE